MKKKQQRYVIKGMNKDLSISKGNNEYSFHNYNIRIDVDEDNSLLSITNEKGTKEVCNIKGIVLGYSELDDLIVLFAKDVDIDYIYLFDGKDLTILYEGNLNFSLNNPIECTSIIESEDVKRVYWVDGLNVIRSINIKDKRLPNVSNTYFNVDSNLKGGEVLSIKKDYSGGLFPAGLIQYFFTYFNSFGKESAVFLFSDTYYLSFKDRGGSPEEIVDCAFTIDLDNLNTEYEYIRVYSNIYTSKSIAPITQLVGEYKITDSKVSVFDNNTSNEIVDTYELLFKGSESFTANTITSKDNTLFLANYSNLRKEYIDYTFNSPELKEDITYGGIIGNTIKLYDNYRLDESKEKQSHFKQGECYVLGVVFKHHNGKYSNPIWVSNYTVKNALEYKTKDDILEYYKPELLLKIPTELKEKAISLGYIQILPIIHKQPIYKRKVLCSGIFNPTVYNVGDRKDNSPYFQSSWFFRPNASIEDMKYIYSNGIMSSIAEYRHDKNVGLSSMHNGEIRNYANDDIEEVNYDNTNSWTPRRSRYSIDRKCVSLYSPDIELITNSIEVGSIDIRGIVPIHFNTSKYDITASSPSKGIGNTDINLIKGNNTNTAYHTLLAVPTWHEDAYGDSPVANINFLVYPFNSIGSLSDSDGSNNEKKTSQLNKKLLYINRKSYYTIPFNSTYSIKVEDSILVDKQEDILYDIKKDDESVFFKNYINKVLTTNGDSLGGSNVYYPIIKGERIGDSSNGFTEDNYAYNVTGRYYGSSGVPITYINDTQIVLTLTQELPSIYPTNTTLSKGNIESQDIKMLKGFRRAIVERIIPYEGHTEYEGKYYNYIKNNDNTIEFKFANTNESLERFIPYLPKATSTINNAISQYINNGGIIGNYIKEVYFKSSYSSGKVGVFEDHFIGFYDNMNYGYVVFTPNKDEEGYTYNEFFSNSIKFLNEVLPNIIESTYSNETKKENKEVILNDYISNFNQNDIISNIRTSGFMLIGDLVSNVDITSDNYIKNKNTLVWNVGGKLHDINSEYIRYTSGDFFVGRYDSIGTLPRKEDDINQIIDIMSFICESRVNTSLYYDKNRLSDSNTNVNKNNFNKKNEVYDSDSTLLLFTGVEKHSVSEGNYPVNILYTKRKHLREYIDTWQHITGVSSYSLEGVYGQINKLIKHNDNILSFQDNAIATILFNPRVQLQTSDNVPIELSNSNKLEGHRYISTEVGCTNKYSVVSCKLGVMFIDDNSDIMYLLSNALEPISEKYGFRGYMQERSNKTNYTPRKEATISYYDKYRGDVYIINNTCLSFSEKLNAFESFFGYLNVEAMFNINSELFSIHLGKIWKHRSGEYNSIYGKPVKFYINYKINPEGMNNKVFTNIEFRGDSFQGHTLKENIELESIKVYNEYQEGNNDLEYSKILPSNIKKKFRVWRADIPRQKGTMLRVANPWCNIILTSNNTNTKTVIHDLTVTYYE